MPLGGFEPATQLSEFQHATSGLLQICVLVGGVESGAVGGGGARWMWMDGELERVG